tara:strand:- start:1233 stop:2123 length:891 start_codon:yes stop_codon:yes gene_type:complete
MDFKKLNSKTKISIIVGIILFMSSFLTFFDFGLNSVSNSENNNEKSDNLSQSQLKNDLSLENEYLEDEKKKSDVLSQSLDSEKSNIRNSEYEKSNKSFVLNNNTKNFDGIEKSGVNKNKVDSSKVFADPEMTVKFLHEGLKKINSKNNSDFKNVLNLIDHTYDSEKMLKLIIGADWKKLKSEKKKELIIAFKKYISKNYLKRFSKIKEVSFKNEEKEKISSGLFLIKSNLVIKKENISIDYLLSFNKNSWKIFDVLLDGSISEIATKKSEFRMFIKEKKIDSLIDALEKFNSQITS